MILKLRLLIIFILLLFASSFIFFYEDIIGNSPQKNIECNNDNMYLFVNNTKIIDSCSNEVQIYGINWFGFETPDAVVHGLWANSLDNLLYLIKNAGFNTIRIPLSIENLDENYYPKTINYEINPQLSGLTSMEVLDLLIDKGCENDLYIILDNHRNYNTHISEKMYEGDYNEEKVLRVIRKVINRYKDKKCVIGFDIKNEPHGSITWNEWAQTSTKVGNEILSVNPNLLILVGGIELKKNEEIPYYSFWGEYIGNTDLVNIDTSKLIFSPHTYGPSVANQDYFNDENFPDNMPPIWDRYFGHVKINQSRAVIIGEFGGDYKDQDKIWQDKFIEYLSKINITNIIYWSLNPNSKDTKGILKEDWKTYNQEKLTLLSKLKKE